uniref:3'-5' exonuclease n=1 Tax=Melanopsichium pennsylvanicum 4 TaxID=1398559 RepID=A0A077QZG9_9BASI|nr:ribonuclease h-like protein [Melanopsichium pennsylvanicum 4]
MRSSTNRKPVVGGAKRAPKTWTSTHGNRFEPSSSSSSSSSSTSAYSRAATKKQYRPNVFAPTAAQLARETERQELELGLEVYSHKSPAGPPHMYGTPFLAPLCKPWSSSFTLDSNLNHVTRNKTERLKAPLLAYTNNPDEAVDLLSCLGPGPMGLDLEWNVDFRKGAKPTALLQICSPVLIVIVHLSAMNHYIPPILRSILQDATIIKTGVAIKNDALKLQRDFGINTRNIVELSNLAKLAQPYRWKSAGPLIALRDLTRVYLGKKLSKDQVRTSDWERWPLSDQQVEYAASDTLVGLEVLRAIFMMMTVMKQELRHRPWNWKRR